MPGIIEWKNLTVHGGYGAPELKSEDMIAWLEEFGLPFTDYICNTTEYLGAAVKAGKNIMFEAQLGALRDIDFGIVPYTSSSYTISSFAPIGAGIPFAHLDKAIGIMKAYSSCVGEGPFTCELFGDEAKGSPRRGRRVRCCYRQAPAESAALISPPPSTVFLCRVLPRSH